MSMASRASCSPAPMRFHTSRMSLSPARPFMPEPRLNRWSISSMDMPATRARWKTAAGSMSPVRPPMTRPSSGVRPMEVSTACPATTAEAEAPLPRCRTTCLRSSRPRNSETAPETNWWLVP